MTCFAEPLKLGRLFSLKDGYFVALESGGPKELKNTSPRQLYFGKNDWTKIYSTRINPTGRKNLIHTIQLNRTTVAGLAQVFYELVYGFDDEGQPLIADVVEKIVLTATDHVSTVKGTFASIEVRCDDSQMCGRRDDKLLTKVNVDLSEGKLLLIPSGEPVIKYHVYRVANYSDWFFVFKENMVSAELFEFEYFYVRNGLRIEVTEYFQKTPNYFNYADVVINTHHMDGKKAHYLTQLSHEDLQVFLTAHPEYDDSKKLPEPKLLKGLCQLLF